MQTNRKTPYLLKAALEQNGWLKLPAEGTSMYPVIEQNDICRFVPCTAASMKKGDIILFHTSAGKLVTHRFLESQNNGQKTYYIFKGDTNLAPDEPIIAEQVIGRLDIINKKKISIRTDRLYHSCWSKLLFAFPVLSGILRSYLNKKNSRAV